MKKKRIIICSSIIVVFVVIVAFIIKDKLVTSAEYSSEYNRTFGEFTAKTASELLKDSQENTCYSPVSLFAALTLVAENTECDTQEEIIELFGVEDIEQLEQYYNKMLEEGVMVEAEDEKTPIVLCNSLWILEDYLEDDSSKVISRSVEKTGSEIFICDEILPEEINEWVSKKTNSQITNIADSYEEMSSALINTLYYNSAWKNPFIEIGKDIFILNDGSKESVECTFL